MNWSRIKTVLIFLLLAANIYLLFVIISQHRVSARVDPSEIEEASALLLRDGITIGPDALSGERLDLKVWRSAYGRGVSDGGLREYVIGRLFGQAGYTQSLTAAGVDVAVDGIGTLNFIDSDPLYFRFIAEGCDYDGSADEAASDPASDRQVSFVRKLNLANQLESFLAGEESPISSSDARADIRVDLAIYDRAGRRYVAHYVQRIDGVDIDGAEGFFSVKSDRVDYFSGSVILMSGAASYNAELLDEINILFLERDAMRSGYETEPEATSAPDGDEALPSDVADTAPEPEKKRVTVTGTSAVYCVIWNSDRSEYYLIPSWTITYSDGAVSTRNAVNGSQIVR